MSLSWSEFEKVDMRAGTVVSAEPFVGARKPAYIHTVDFGPEIGMLRSSAQVTVHYTPEELVGKQIIGVVNFPKKQIGKFMSVFLVTGLYADDGSVVLAVPDKRVSNGAKLGSTESAMSCCDPLHPSLVHKSLGRPTDVSAATLREAGRRLKPDESPSVLESTIREISEIFLSKSPHFCPVTVGLRRSCILFINWLQIIGVDSPSTPTLGSLLTHHISRIEPKLISVFLSESLEVIRLLRECGHTPQQVEVFPLFVSASRKLLTTSSGGVSNTPSDGRGILLQIPSAAWAGRAIGVLSKIVGETVSNQPEYVTESLSVKLGMCLMALVGDSASAEWLLLAARVIPQWMINSNPELWLRIDLHVPAPVEVEGQDVVLPNVLSRISMFSSANGDVESGAERAGEEVVVVTPAVLISRILNLDNKSENLGILPFFQHSPATTHTAPLRQTLASIAITKRSSVDLFVPSKDKISPTIVSKLVAQFCSRQDLPSLSALAEREGFSSIRELVVDHMGHVILVHFLSVLDNSAGAATFLISKILDNKYSLHQLVDSAFSEAVTALFVELAASGRNGGSEEICKNVIQLMGNSASAVGTSSSHGGGPSKKARHDSNRVDPLHQVLMENYLHILQLIEASPVYRRGRMLALLIESVGGGVVTNFAVRTVEAVTASSPSPNVWSVFARAIAQDTNVVSGLIANIVDGKCDDRELLDRLVLQQPKVLQALHRQEGDLVDVLEVMEGLEHELCDEDRIVSTKLALVRCACERLRSVGVTELAEKLGRRVGSGTLVLALLDFVKHNVDNVDVVRAVSHLLSKVGVFSLPPTSTQPAAATEAPREVLGISSDVGRKSFATKAITKFLIPKLKLNSHALAVQDLLAVLGGSSFLNSQKSPPDFSKETILVLTPYLSSSYRPSASVPIQLSQSQVANSVEEFFAGLLLRMDSKSTSPYKPLFESFRIAVRRDVSLCCWILPVMVEAIASEPSSGEHVKYVTESLLNLLGASGGADGGKRQVETMFEILDWGRRIISAKKHGKKDCVPFLAQVVDMDVSANGDLLRTLVNAAMGIEDYARALQYHERLILLSPEKRSSSDDVLRFIEIYKRLGMMDSVVGACTLAGEVVAEVEEIRKIQTGRIGDVLGQGEVGPVGERRFELLMEGCRFRSAVQAAEGWDEKVAEAVFKLGDWSHGPDRTCSEGDRGYYCALVRIVGDGVADTADVGALVAEVVKKNSMALNYSDIGRIFNLSLLTSRSPFTPQLLQEVLSIVRQMHPRTRPAVIECMTSLSSRLGDTSHFAWRSELLRHYRKSGDLQKLRILLALSLPPMESPIDCHCEYAKSCWATDQRSLARDHLNRILSPTSGVKAKLLLLKWSAEMEVMIPKLVIAGYRELLSLSSAPTASTGDKMSANYAFADYLDNVGVIVADTAAVEQTSSVWNKQELVKEIGSAYFEAMRFDSTGRRVLSVINRLFQLHWECDSGGNGKLAIELVQVVNRGWKLLPKWVWYSALPQLLARLGASELGRICEEITTAVLAEYPRQAGWFVFPLLQSRHQERREIGGRIVQAAVGKSEYPNMAQLVQAMRLVCESLVGVARFDPSTSSGGMKLLSDCKEGTRLLRNTGGLLVMPVKDQIAVSGGPFVGGNEVRISKFLDPVHVYSTKAKPKRVSALDGNGREFSFIVKVEKKTDLRKDARLMDFVSLVNREAAKRSALPQPLRTYSVLTLSEDAALIEFIPNLVTMRRIIDEALAKQGKSVSLYLNKDVMQKLSHKTDGFPFFQSVVDTVPPMIAEWLAAQFSVPKQWLAARTCFSTSQAAWSVVGHIVGLGDRHPDNILIDTNSGEVVHVDFDCIFSRGMILTIPELVPFRLTKICVSAMGVTGVEGLFRNTSERLLRLLREKKKTLLSVLHAFIADPLIDWSSGSNPGATHKKAKEVISAIEKKLNGYVDVGEMRAPSAQEEKLITYNEASEKNTGLGRDRGAPLSVEGQVDELIRAAVCPRNLAKMYLGWMPLF